MNMQIYHRREDLPVFKQGVALTIGNFDGVHLGHQKLIERVLKAQNELGCGSMVMTFDPHPVKVLRPEMGLKRLFDLRDTYEQLKTRGIESLFVIPFSREFSQLSPEQFFFNYIAGPLNPKFIAVGHDFSFGADRRGSFATLEKLCKQESIGLEKIDPVYWKGEVVSSSRIRSALNEGEVDKARELLGRPFSIRGVVEKGYARGRQLGFPTANLRVLGESLPASGVYVTRTCNKDQTYWSVTNVGYNPTFKGKSEFSPVKVESHLLKFAGDLYGVELKTEFFQKVRDEKKFDSVEQLRAQIEKDVEWTRQWVQQLK